MRLPKTPSHSLLPKTTHVKKAGDDDLHSEESFSAPPANVRRTWNLDLTASLLAAGVICLLEMGPAIAKKGYNASDLELAILTSGRSFGMLLAFLAAHLAQRYSPVSILYRLQVATSICLIPLFFVRPHLSFVFVALHVGANIFWSLGIPARVTIYRANFPTHERGRLVGRVRQLQLVVTTLVALFGSIFLDWSLGKEELVKVLGKCPLPLADTLQYSIAIAAVLAFAGSRFIRRIRIESFAVNDSDRTATPWAMLREFHRVWREDRPFRRFQCFFFLFGFANIMTIPLTQIYAVEELKVGYFELAMINVVLVFGGMAVTMVWWGKQVDRFSPSAVRGILNLIFALDPLALALAPSIGWIYVGRICRGIAFGGGTLVWMLGPLYFARDPHRAPLYSGIHTALTGLRWAIAPFVGVKLLEYFDANTIFFISFVVLVVTGIGMWWSAKFDRAETAASTP